MLGVVSLVFALSVPALAQSASGPLRVHPENPRYFADAGGEPVYLTGSHTWNTLQDMESATSASLFDFAAYLDFLERHHHNFIRLWRWELAAWDLTASCPFDTDSKKVLAVAPHPWPRTGGGSAFDGSPRSTWRSSTRRTSSGFRSRVAGGRPAGDLRLGDALRGLGTPVRYQRLEAHPFNPANNVNGIDGDPNADGRGLEVHTLAIPAVLRLQEAYVRKVDRYARRPGQRALSRSRTRTAPTRPSGSTTSSASSRSTSGPRPSSTRWE